MISPVIVKNCLSELNLTQTVTGKFFSLKKLTEQGFKEVEKLPVSLQIILESLLRKYDDNIVTMKHILSLINWKAGGPISGEIPFFVSRIILQDYSGLPLLNDMSAMRDAVEKIGTPPSFINPLLPTTLVIDHTIETHYTASKDALKLNMSVEVEQNLERYQFLKWSANAFNNLEIIPPGSGIIHQINLEYLVKGVFCDSQNIYYPDTLVGTDSHTTMCNGIGIVGWGVGGIEAGAAMLGAPIFLTIPDIVGVHLTGQLREGVTSTDLVLTITEILRKAKVIGKIVEYFGRAIISISAQERATIANMAPDYGALMGLFPIDERTIQYLHETGRTENDISKIVSYYKAQGWFGAKELGDCHYNQIIDINLNDIHPSIAGPKRPQDRINLEDSKKAFEAILTLSQANGGYGHSHEVLNKNIQFNEHAETITHGDIIIAAITSCTNTSNPHLLITAGLLAKKAYQKGLRVKSYIKTSLSPGSKVVAEYLDRAGLLIYLEKLGFFITGYGCTTCIGNVGKIDQDMEKIIKDNNLIVSSVLSGNRNFESRIHPYIRANFLMSPPLVVAFAIAGTIRINLQEEPLGVDETGTSVFLRDIWPSSVEIEEMLLYTKDASIYQNIYKSIMIGNPNWENILINTDNLYCFNNNSSFITKSPFFSDFTMLPTKPNNIIGARALLILGNSITTDHISPVGKIDEMSPAGQYLLSQGEVSQDLGTYGARRGNHEVMLRGTFANIRLKNKILNNVEGAFTFNMLTNQQASIYDTAMDYQQAGIASIIFAGEEYGSGSARDWAAKGTHLLGIKIVIANSFERIHRSNLVGMGIIPCLLQDKMQVEQLELSGYEIFDIFGIEHIQLGTQLELIIRKQNNEKKTIVYLDPQLANGVEVDYIHHGGIMPYTLRNLLRKSKLEYISHE